jgi:hypothetical protein
MRRTTCRGDLRSECKGTVRLCAAKSTYGKPGRHMLPDTRRRPDEVQHQAQYGGVPPAERRGGVHRTLRELLRHLYRPRLRDHEHDHDVDYDNHDRVVDDHDVTDQGQRVAPHLPVLIANPRGSKQAK